MFGNRNFQIKKKKKNIIWKKFQSNVLFMSINFD